MTAREQLMGARVQLASPWADPTMPRPQGVLVEDADGRVQVRWDAPPSSELLTAPMMTLDVLEPAALRA